VVSFQITVLKVLAGHPAGRASLDELRRVVTSGAAHEIEFVVGDCALLWSAFWTGPKLPVIASPFRPFEMVQGGPHLIDAFR
jgi:hypothetical protein